LKDTIEMPGNQGGSNWGTTAADPRKGLVFVVNVNEVAILKLEDVRTRAGRPGSAGLQAYQQYCQPCHGANLQGVPGGLAPPLVDVVNRLSEDTIRAIVTGGKGTMRPVPNLADAELTSLIGFLANPTLPGGRSVPAVETFPPGPVVASGGAKLPPRIVPAVPPPMYGGIGGNGGNTPYPSDVTIPPVRYVTEYGVMASATAPPYTTLTAYDLNTGTIKWQVPIGDDPATIAAGGPTNTGGLGARNGMFVTKTGLVFVAGGDRKVRAYDEDDGSVLWTGALPGNSSGIPASYESKGRQYIVFSSAPGGRRSPAPAVSSDAPRGYIAFAVPLHDKSTTRER
jgi:quinoprotein glucose dehydrogenase